MHTSHSWQSVIDDIPNIPIPRIVSTKPLGVGRFLELKQHMVQHPDGSESPYEWVHRTHAGGEVVQILPVTIARTLILVAEYRLLVGKWVITMPSGLVDAGETPEAAAKRECREEVGYTSDRVAWVMRTPSSTGMTDETIEQYILWDARPDPRGMEHGPHELIRILEVKMEDFREIMQIPIKIPDTFAIDSKLFSALAYANIAY